MLDLFGDTITAPTLSVQKQRSGVNLAYGFPEFWDAYPSGPRKAAKKQCLDKWARHECAYSYQIILQHLEWMKASPDWTKDGGAFVCAPLVYLNKQGWVEWAPPTKTAPKHDVLAELKAHKGTKPSAETLARIAQIKGLAVDRQGATA